MKFCSYIKGGFKINMAYLMSLEIYPEKGQKWVKLTYAKTVLQNSKIFWFWTMEVLSSFTCAYSRLWRKKSCNLCPTIIIKILKQNNVFNTPKIIQKVSENDKIIC